MSSKEQNAIGYAETKARLADAPVRSVAIRDTEKALAGSDPARINPYANGARRAIAEVK